MVNLEVYDKAFEEHYYLKVKSKLTDRKIRKLVNSSKKFFQSDFYSGTSEEALRELILAPYSKLKETKEYIEKNSLHIMQSECFRTTTKGKTAMKCIYSHLNSDFKSIMKLRINKEDVRVRIAKNNGKLTVCPYCNRDYINSRGEDISGAQIDHFYSYAKYPIFTLCLYNLVPSCGNCNRIKNDSDIEYISPWDQSVDWDSAVQFSCLPKSDEEYQVVITTEGSAENNIDSMKIRDAYSIHSVEVKELLEKHRFYCESQNEEMRSVMKNLPISEQDIKRVVFGPPITSEMIKKKSLGRMTRDLHRKLGIYH